MKSKNLLQGENVSNLDLLQAKYGFVKSKLIRALDCGPYRIPQQKKELEKAI